jgi:protein-tyrosine-phosphatase
MLSHDQVMNIFKALSDPNRLQVFELLLLSDRTNSELMDETGLRQNLLSHHLNILNEAGLIQMSQSIGDARRHYYNADLCTVSQFRKWWGLRTPPTDTPLPALTLPRRVLFLCLRNLSRSLIAEALARHLAPDALIVTSAGLENNDSSVPPVTLQVLAEHGISADDLTFKRYDELEQTEYDYLITVCDIVHENLIPDTLSYQTYVHWSLRDPVEGVTDPQEQLRLARELYHDIYRRIALLVQMLAAAEMSENVG